MRITVNGEEQSVSTETLEALLETLQYNAQLVATAHNGTFVPRADRKDTALTEGDRVEIVSPIEGG